MNGFQKLFEGPKIDIKLIRRKTRRHIEGRAIVDHAHLDLFHHLARLDVV